jgi:hypothetical protein
LESVDDANSYGAANPGGSRPFEAALREQQTPLGLRNWTTKLLSRLDPLTNDDLSISKRLLLNTNFVLKNL